MKIRIRLTPVWWARCGELAMWAEAQRLAFHEWPDAVLKVTLTSLHAVIMVKPTTTFGDFIAVRDRVRFKISQIKAGK